ncbi:hypothetical protein HPP92_005883 [Vanilla planifolia]|uniref:30S ribosomal protein 3, chloroplastic n=1 Tax=Vanilla planifolia TaxID=51239 RepID=A0A835VDA0_VANPL|nr:hypothetical protein HPP92_006143 [Vanilla planifolia]KAG0494889.1 hypothetical protein HPP92_005883 [Vanilla planifolia]
MASSVYSQPSNPLSLSASPFNYKLHPSSTFSSTLFTSSFSPPAISLTLAPSAKPFAFMPPRPSTFTASEDFEVPSAVADYEGEQMRKGRMKVGKMPLKKPRLVLKFIWMEKNIGLGLDQMITGHGNVPLSPYYFWPRKDAWEELKTKLEEKPWISQKRMIILLNQATDIINLWQQGGGNL